MCVKYKVLSKILCVFAVVLMLSGCNHAKRTVRQTIDFNENWFFNLTTDDASPVDYNCSAWRQVNLPHDWSIEGEFSADNPATSGGGALPGGIGWYRKVFKLSQSDTSKKIFIDFDGIYWNSSVFLNGKLIGYRPNGYISFRYDLTPYLNFGEIPNVIAVKVDNSNQPNSRWYSGSGIYRNVRLVKTDPVHVDLWGTFITTPRVDSSSAKVDISITINNSTEKTKDLQVLTDILDNNGRVVAVTTGRVSMGAKTRKDIKLSQEIANPSLWSVRNPYLYTARTYIEEGKELLDNYETTFGIRYFGFDPDKGFLLNGECVKILGVCNHHDLGCLGTAINARALERQLEILKSMGCNGIRTSHNPPAPELLELCDKMGFIVMDEAFDMWRKKKSAFDYSQYWDKWHARDLKDQLIRDRNHPSVFVWSIGNEILEQWDSSGINIARELVTIVKSIDSTRPVTTACNPPTTRNNLILSGVFDLIGYNYAQKEYEKHKEVFPGKSFVATETVSGLMTRGHYDMPSDSIRRWPLRWDIPFTGGNPDLTVSAYDNVSAPWGSTHEETWKIIKKYDYLSGMYIWTGFDYIGEPTPYVWPARSSYFGIIDLAGFPKDVFYMYQSEWTDKPVLHLFPHWNWHEGETIDMVVYTNCVEVELFLNDKSQGVKKKEGDRLRLTWHLKYVPGTVKAVGKCLDGTILTQEVKTAGKPAKIKLTADRSVIKANGKDLSFITVEIYDNKNVLVPKADNLVRFNLEGNASIAGVDNGCQTSHEPFKANYRKAFNGKCLVVVQSGKDKGSVKLTATSDGLDPETIELALQ
jgi:beta-galactosidase